MPYGYEKRERNDVIKQRKEPDRKIETCGLALVRQGYRKASAKAICRLMIYGNQPGTGAGKQEPKLLTLMEAVTEENIAKQKFINEQIILGKNKKQALANYEHWLDANGYILP